MTIKIKAIRNTILTKDHHKKTQGESLSIQALTDLGNGYSKATLAYGAGTWILKNSDWDLPKKDDTVKPHLINWNDFSSKVSKYFTVGEVTNMERRRIPTSTAHRRNIYKLAQELDKVRDAWGSPIIVTSWYRPLAVNRAIGSFDNSQHVLGNAADVKPANGKLFQFQNWLDTGIWNNRALGYGAKKGFVHLDRRQGKIRWNY